MKFKTDFTKGGHKIIAIVGPDDCEGYAGVVDDGGYLFGVTWDRYGEDVNFQDEDPFAAHDLVPLEPKTLVAYAVLGKNNGLALFIDRDTAEEVAERENGQVIDLKGEYYV